METSASKRIHNVWKSFSGWTLKEKSDDVELILTSPSQEGGTEKVKAAFQTGQEMTSLAAQVHCPETGIREPSTTTRRRCRGSFIDEDRRVTLLWSDVWAETRVGKRGRICEKILGTREKKMKTILKGVSGVARPGNLIAVMGASGAGKSTLMNVLTQHNLSKLEVRGQVIVTDSNKTLPSVDEISTYIQQEDEFIGSLTVREHLTFQARLRMSRDTSMEEKMEQVDDVLEQLSLMKCAHSSIGSPTASSRISGGERKRLSFASELLTNPPLLFCDEPTSGLDSYMSEVLISVLRQLALEGHTILCTIHQPSSDVYSMFDRLILMADGRCAYQGDVDQAVGYFGKLGYQCPVDYCPADYFIDTLSIRPGMEDHCRSRVHVLCTAYDCSTESHVIKTNIEEEHIRARTSSQREDIHQSATSQYEASCWQQFYLLLWRCSVDVLRDPSLLQSYLATSVGLGVVLGLLYLHQPYNQSSIQNINGLLFLVIVQISTTTPARIAAVIPNELPLIIREHRRGMYSTETYVIARFLVEVLTHVSQTWIILGIAYYMVGLNVEIVAFFVAMGTSALMTVTSVSFGAFLSSVSSSSAVALNLMIPIFFLFTLFGGFYINPVTTPVYFIWVRFVSWYPAVYEMLLVNQWDTIQALACKVNSTLPCLADGKQVLERYGCYQENVVLDLILVALMATGYLLLAILGIRARVPGRGG